MMKTRHTALLVAAWYVTLAVGSAHAAVIAQYTLDSTNKLVATNLATGVSSVSDLVVNDQVEDTDGLPLGDDQYLFTSTSMLINRFNNVGEEVNWRPPTATPEAPLDFVITADASFEITVDSITVTVGPASTHVLAVYFGIEETSGGYGTGVNIVPGDPTKTISLASSHLIAAGNSKTFYVDLNSSAFDSTHEIDNIQINGSIVPEPSTLALAALGLIGLLACGRRRRR